MPKFSNKESLLVLSKEKDSFFGGPSLASLNQSEPFSCNPTLVAFMPYATVSGDGGGEVTLLFPLESSSKIDSISLAICPKTIEEAPLVEAARFPGALSPFASLRDRVSTSSSLFPSLVVVITVDCLEWSSLGELECPLDMMNFLV